MAKSVNIYLDHAAATPVDPAVIKVMGPYLDSKFYNPSAIYRPALAVKEDLDSARKIAAHWLGCRSNEIVFTAGGSEANNLAIHGVLRQFPTANIVTSAIEHDSVLEPAKRYDHRLVQVHNDGRINLEELDAKIDKNTVLVSIMYANSEIGTIQPIKQISKLISQKRTQKDRKLPLFFHVDACQAANYLDLHVSRLGVDMMSLNGGKIYGPKQSGVLYLKAGLELLPLVDGGGQERGIRSGTQNVAGAIGFAKALEVAQLSRNFESDRLKQLQQTFIEMISEKIPTAKINGSVKYRLPNNLNFKFSGTDNEIILMQLDYAGILASTGSACSASDNTPSHVLKSIRLTDDEARSSLRFTMGRQTSLQNIQKTVNILATLVK